MVLPDGITYHPKSLLVIVLMIADIRGHYDINDNDRLDKDTNIERKMI